MNRFVSSLNDLDGSLMVTGLRASSNLYSHCVVKLHEATQTDVLGGLLCKGEYCEEVL